MIFKMLSSATIFAAAGFAAACSAQVPAAPGVKAPAAPSAKVAPAATPAFTSESTDIGTLIDNAGAKAIVDKYLPGFSANPQIDMARSMTLKQIQSYSSDTVTDAVLANIDADLAKLPAPK